MEPLAEESVRVLGCLIEKERETPAYYPLTLRSLIDACNQKSKRDPVMSLDETAVAAALVDLRERDLAARIQGGDARVPKYRHRAAETLGLDPAETAVLGVLMLRGPQTVGEVRGRTNRMFAFADLEHVAGTLEALAARADPLVAELPRLPGTKETRWTHLLAGMPEVPDAEAYAAPVAAAPKVPRGDLEREVAALREELDALRAEFEAFRNQFD